MRTARFCVGSTGSGRSRRYRPPREPTSQACPAPYGIRRALKDRRAAPCWRLSAALASVTVVVAERARHFVMLDDPSFLYETLNRFLPPMPPSAR